jgi:hypothetical protein
MTPTLADLGVMWAPNIESGVLVAREQGEARLVLGAYFGDADQRHVVLVWRRARAVRMEPPNDKAISGHRLYDLGLREVHWVGEVRESALIADLERRNRVHPRHDPRRYDNLRHWVVRLKGRIVEVVAVSCEVQRADHPGSSA